MQYEERIIREAMRSEERIIREAMRSEKKTVGESVREIKLRQQVKKSIPKVSPEPKQRYTEHIPKDSKVKKVEYGNGSVLYQWTDEHGKMHNVIIDEKEDISQNP